jgi:hypothetical protein
MTTPLDRLHQRLASRDTTPVRSKQEKRRARAQRKQARRDAELRAIVDFETYLRIKRIGKGL